MSTLTRIAYSFPKARKTRWFLHRCELEVGYERVFLARHVKSTLSDDEESGNDEDQDDQVHRFAFPDLDAKIRQAIRGYGAVFPKLNFSSPKVLLLLSLLVFAAV